LALMARQVASGVGNCEGPVIRSDGEIVVSSMDQGRLYKISGERAEVLADVGHRPNGSTEWSDGTLYVCQSGGTHWGPNAGLGGIIAVARDGTWRWVTQDPIRPNDLCFGPDGLLYVTDPTGNRPARDDGRLFRCNIETGEAELLCSLPWFPNGIAFGLEEDAIYVARSIEFPGDLQSGIVRFSLDGGRLGTGETFIHMPPSHRPDGFLFDAEGNVVIGCNANNRENAEPGRIQVYDRQGKHLDTFVPGPNKMYTNVALGPDRMLVITDTAGGSVLAVDNWPHPGLPLFPFRKNK
jgi:gluconolactonase